MSTLKEGAACMECMETGRCNSSCLTQGGGLWLGTGTSAADAQIIVTPCFMPDGSRGVRVTQCQLLGERRHVIHNQYDREAGTALASFILTTLGKP